MPHMRFALLTIAIGVAMFLLILLLIEVGRRFGVRQAQKRGDSARTGVGSVDAAVYGMFGLLLGFTFSGAAARFDSRRALVVDEVNAISTAWMRIDLLPSHAQPPIRDAFKRYLDALLAVYDRAPGTEGELRQRAVVSQQQGEIWNRVLAASLDPSGEKARVLIIPTVNEMFDVVDKERLAQRLHPPPMIFVMLGLSALAVALFAGYSMANGTARNWLHTIGVAATIAVTVSVILELESPRLGFIRVDTIDNALEELRETMDVNYSANGQAAGTR